MINKLTELDIKQLNSKSGLTALLEKEPFNVEKALRFIKYEKRLKKLRTELIRLQTWAIENEERFKKKNSNGFGSN